MASIEDKAIDGRQFEEEGEAPPLHVQLWRATKNGGGMFTEA